MQYLVKCYSFETKFDYIHIPTFCINLLQVFELSMFLKLRYLYLTEKSDAQIIKRSHTYQETNPHAVPLQVFRCDCIARHRYRDYELYD